MAPLLALGAYYLTGKIVSPKEVENQNQKLRLLGQCLPIENACIFTLGDMEIKLISNEKKQQYQLAAITNKPVENLTIALGKDAQFQQFPMMKSDNGKYWQIRLEDTDNILNYNNLRMALSFQKKSYFAESVVIFNGN